MKNLVSYRLVMLNWCGSSSLLACSDSEQTKAVELRSPALLEADSESVDKLKEKLAELLEEIPYTFLGCFLGGRLKSF